MDPLLATSRPPRDLSEPVMAETTDAGTSSTDSNVPSCVKTRSTKWAEEGDSAGPDFPKRNAGTISTLPARSGFALLLCPSPDVEHV
jgi:hypothetical protein